MDKILLKYIEEIEKKYKCDFLILESRIEVLEQNVCSKVIVKDICVEEPKRNLFSKIIKQMKK